MRLFYVIDVAASRSRIQSLSRAHLLKTKFPGSRKQHPQHVADAGQQPVAYMPLVNDVTDQSDLAHRRLQGDPIGPQIFLPTLPPVRLLLHDLAEFCLGYFATLASLDKDFTAHVWLA
jgi:hypothetical protein